MRLVGFSFVLGLLLTRHVTSEATKTNIRGSGAQEERIVEMHDAKFWERLLLDDVGGSMVEPSTPATSPPATSPPTPAPTNRPPTPGAVTDPPTMSPTPGPQGASTPQPTLPPTPMPVPVTTAAPTPQPTLSPTPMPVPVVTPLPTPQPTLPSTTSMPVPVTTAAPTPQPTLSPTPMPVPDVTPLPTPQATLPPTPMPVPDVTPLPTPQPTIPPTPMPVPDATPLPTPQPTVPPTPMPVPDATPLPTPQPTVPPTPMPVPDATPLPTVPPTPVATAQPTPVPTVGSTPDPTLPPTPVSTVATAPPSGSSTLVNELTNIIRGVADTTALDTPGTYQNQALQFVLESTAMTDPPRVIQRYALAAFYFATNGVSNPYFELVLQQTEVSNWIEEAGWLTDPDECTWFRVTCDANGLVTILELNSNRVFGTMPNELGLLTSLTRLNLGQNGIYSPSEDGHSWLTPLANNLEQLILAGNYLESDTGVPAAVGSLTGLNYLDVSYNLYNGNLQGSVFSPLSGLEYLAIGGNFFGGTIPAELAALPNLQFFYPESSDLTGGLGFVLNMPVLTEMWADNNPFQGTIPTQIAQVTSLRSLSLSNTQLTGPIPTELASLDLFQLWLYSNSLTGTIPEAFGFMDPLERLVLHGNPLVGIMPSSICELLEPSVGILLALTADCQDPGGTIECSCCTCCGPTCPSR